MDATIKFNGNTADNGGAILSDDSVIIFYGNAYFENNRAIDGGAIFFTGHSNLRLALAINISFIQNHADSRGGVIYFQDYQCSSGSTLPIECFLSIYSDNNTTRDIPLLFLNNSAWLLGSTLYRGQLSRCRLYYRLIIVWINVVTNLAVISAKVL